MILAQCMSSVKPSSAKPHPSKPGSIEPSDATGEASGFRAHLPAARVDAELRKSLSALQRAEKCVVLWFAEILQRKLYRELGYSSIHQYAHGALGFSPNKTYRFLRLAADLERLPQLRASVAKGEIGWTKAREVVKVASPANELRWIAEAKRSNRRELERKVSEARQRAAAKRRANPKQAELMAGDSRVLQGAQSQTLTAHPITAEAPIGEAPLTDAPMAEALVADAPVAVVFRLTPIQLARYEALIEKIHKSRAVMPGTTREQILLMALDELLASAEGKVEGKQDAETSKEAEASKDAETSKEAEASKDAGEIAETGVSKDLLPRGKSVSNYRIISYRCELCQKATVQTNRGAKGISAGELEAAACDAVIERRGERSRSTIPPSVRRAVMERDGYRCQAPGCTNTHFLEVHHRLPRANGGSNHPENLVTLCSRCHKLWHARGWGEEGLSFQAIPAN